MSTITTKDGVTIFLKIGAAVSPSYFPMAGLCQPTIGTRQMMFFLNRGFRVIAHDRRGHGRSSQPADGSRLWITMPMTSRP